MKGLETISFRELERYKKRKDCVIIDLRSRGLYEEGHVGGAWNIPYSHLDQALSMLPAKKLLLLYCEHGGTAMAAGRRLAEKGYRVKAAVGGFEQ